MPPSAERPAARHHRHGAAIIVAPGIALAAAGMPLSGCSPMLAAPTAPAPIVGSMLAPPACVGSACPACVGSMFTRCAASMPLPLLATSHERVRPHTSSPWSPAIACSVIEWSTYLPCGEGGAHEDAVNT